ncbi:MAG: AAA family ATPase [Phycisphaerae bacterium]|nr:AAA family ATPase [Phycisphaerae bacterium]
MKIKRVEVERFRGIKKLEWNPRGEIACLVGPGDSTKTTILDAIELALSARWSIQFHDTDFYQAKPDSPIRITVTVGDLPEELKSEARYGYWARGWTSEGELRDEPAEDDELVLSIRLQVTSSLEPSWTVVNDRDPEGRPISAKDRESLGCARLGEYLDRHFSWGRSAILSRLTTKGDDLATILASAGRAARATLAGIPPGELINLHNAAAAAKRAGAEFGVAAQAAYRPQLDVEAISVGVGGLSLHDGEVPIRRAGLGTRRLLAAAMQWEVTKAGGVTLVDEIETGLEPHRIRRLLRVLCGTADPQKRRNVLMTTHAPVVLEELDTDHLFVVRSTDGVTKVLDVAPALRPIIRKASESFLARKVLVCEGRTELGLCRRLDNWWSDGGRSFALAGVALADGGGTEAASVAKALADLGYEVVLLGDSDRPLDPDQDTLEAGGTRVMLWDGNVALEERIAHDLPWDGVAKVVRLAMDHWGENPVRDAVAYRLNGSANALAGEPRDWRDSGSNDADLRAAIGTAAKEHKAGNRKGWFKRVDLAEELASVIIAHWDAIAGSDLRQKIDELRRWAHGDE